MRFMIEKVEQVMSEGKWNEDASKNLYPFRLDGTGLVKWMRFGQLTAEQHEEIAQAFTASAERDLREAQEQRKLGDLKESA